MSIRNGDLFVRRPRDDGFRRGRWWTVLREKLVSDLAAWVLGPRRGMRETIRENPVTEYLTGVLAPKKTPGVNPGPLDVDEDVEPTGLDEDDEDAGGGAPHGVFDRGTALDPASRPCSLGLALAVRSPSGSPPKIEVCVTWARYLRADQAGGRNAGWRREPRAFVGTVEGGQWLLLDGGGRATEDPDAAEARFDVVWRPDKSGRPGPEGSLVLTLINELQPSDSRDAGDPEFHLFQPQVRVNLGEGAVLRPVATPGWPEAGGFDAETAFRHRDRSAMARGLMCSAVWRDVDPQRETGGERGADFPEAIERPPFAWVDGQLVEELFGAEARRRFAVPDARTEYLPMVSAPSPDFDFPANGAAVPEFSAEALAEAWDPEAIGPMVSPLVDGYESWVASLRAKAEGIADPVGMGIVRRNERASARMRKSLEKLRRDEEIRLAFCFANRAVALQAEWGGVPGFRWRPFQLAFMLSVLPGLADSGSPDRRTCDLLWIPTGGGKTEAYLGLMAFVLALRRRRRGGEPDGGYGTAVTTRYTLRLLAIQQFRRILRLVTACEALRVEGLGRPGAVSAGWRPRGYGGREPWIWGVQRFSTGLWVGGGVTPNHLEDSWASGAEGKRKKAGALSILRGERGDGNPVQVDRCPACGTFLAVPEKGFASRFVLALVVKAAGADEAEARRRALGVLGGWDGGRVGIRGLSRLPDGDHVVLELDVVPARETLPRDVDRLGDLLAGAGLAVRPFRASLPGYFPRRYAKEGGGEEPFDFEIFCPNPACPIAVPWAEALPAGCVADAEARAEGPTGGVPNVPDPGRRRLAHVPIPFRDRRSPYVGCRVPVPALAVDDQVYGRCPAVVVATVDKFARLSWEPKAGAIFGNVDHHHCLHGFYRLAAEKKGHPNPKGRGRNKNYVEVPPFRPPELVVQDELHLLEGPLGGVAGLYEAAVEALASGWPGDGPPPKYVASTATAAGAEEQTKALFGREVAVFPPGGLRRGDSFFVRFPDDPGLLNDGPPGRLYIGVCAPGRGPLTPTRDIWAALMHSAHEARLSGRVPDAQLDPYWTLTGYFNAVREMAQAEALYRQDVRERLEHMAGSGGVGRRATPEEGFREICGGTTSPEDLPRILEEAATPLGGGDPKDALFATAMFGTGVDVPRLGLMVMHGQPKSTSAYVQSTGRVGRKAGGLVVVFLRAARPRDLSHYEFFVGYHLRLDAEVEPVTVFPFSPGALARVTGPVMVALLRNASLPKFNEVGSAHDAGSSRTVDAADTVARGFGRRLEERGKVQPSGRCPPPGAGTAILEDGVERWRRAAEAHGQSLKYEEYGGTKSPVVLGDPAHRFAGLDAVFPDAPQSMRDLEPTVGVGR